MRENVLLYLNNTTFLLYVIFAMPKYGISNTKLTGITSESSARNFLFIFLKITLVSASLFPIPLILQSLPINSITGIL